MDKLGTHELRRLIDKDMNSDGGWPASVDRSEGGRRESLPEERQVQILMRVNDDCRSWHDWIFRRRTSGHRNRDRVRQTVV